MRSLLVFFEYSTTTTVLQFYTFFFFFTFLFSSFELTNKRPDLFKGVYLTREGVLLAKAKVSFFGRASHVFEASDLPTIQQ